MHSGSLVLSVTVISALLPLAGCGGDLLLPPGAPATVRAVSGDLQEGTTGQRLAEPLVVVVEDASGRPVPGSRIEFRFELASDGGQVTPEAVATDEGGRATATVRLGEDPGAHPVEAVVVDATELRVRFILTAFAPTPRPPTGGGGTGGGNEDGGGDDGGNGGDGGGGPGGDQGGGAGGGDGGGGGAVDGGGGDDHDGGGGRGKDHGRDKGKGGKGGKGG